jgi:3-hydroxy acid dehydrogenase / malonic semialdehyde reductase
MTSNQKICLITGASSGIGKELALQLARKGWQVIALARREDKLKELVSVQENIIPIQCDVSNQEEVVEISARLKKEGLIPGLFILNAGTGDVEKPGTLHRELHQQCFDVNYFGVLNWVDQWLPTALKTKNSVFVATSSLQSVRGMPGAAAYGASKAALNHCFESLDAQYHKMGVRFSLVLPGPVNTPMLKTDDPLPATWEPEQAASYIIKKLEKGKPRIRFPLLWRGVLSFLGLLPTGLYNRLINQE